MTFTRRSLIAVAGVAIVSSLIAVPAMASTINFTVPGYSKLLKSGKPFLLAVNTEWCSTCAAQKRAVSGLRRQSAYKDLALVEMDWDKYRGSKIGKQLRIPRRSTLIMYNATGKEVGRIVAGTATSQIKSLIDKGI